MCEAAAARADGIAVGIGPPDLDKALMGFLIGHAGNGR
jgi:hypothetical protein